MVTETVTLPFEIAREPKVIQACLADRNDFRMLGQSYQLIYGDLAFVFIIRMHADRRVDSVIGFRYCQDLREFRESDRYT